MGPEDPREDARLTRVAQVDGVNIPTGWQVFTETEQDDPNTRVYLVHREPTQAYGTFGYAGGIEIDVYSEVSPNTCVAVSDSDGDVTREAASFGRAFAYLRALAQLEDPDESGDGDG